jgi:hypothetical protein
MSSRRFTLVLASAVALAGAPAFAQPGEREHHGDRDHDHDHDRGDRHGPPGEPPPPQVESPGQRAGFEWIGGHWDWKAGKWTWVKGRWEKEHPGQHWQAGRWEHRGPTWEFVEGTYIVVGAPPPPPGMPPGAAPGAPPPPPGAVVVPVVGDRPIITGFWPQRGKPGARVKIHGRNFAPDIEVLWRGTPVPGAKVSPFEIVFQVPPDATTGMIGVGHEHGGHNLPVGQFDVVTAGDPEAEWKKLEEQRHRDAEAAWIARQKELAAIAKDRAARDAWWKKHEEELEASREERREKRAAEIRAKWEGAFLADADTQAELALHAERVATLDRAKEIAELKSDGKLAVRIDVALGKENARHDQRMTTLQASFGTKGGTP